MKIKILLILLLIPILILIPQVSANNLSLFPNPGLSEVGNNIEYEFNFTSDSACTDVIFSHKEIVTINSQGFGFVTISIPSTMSQIPNYLCEVKDGSIRKVHPMSDQILNNLYAKNINVSRNLNIFGNSSFNGTLMPMTSLTSDIGSGALRWRYGYFQNISSDYADILNNLDVGGDLFVGGVNISGNLTVDGGALFRGAILGDESLGYENIRFGVYSHTPRIIFDNGSLVSQIDFVGNHLRFIIQNSTGGNNRARLRINETFVRVGENLDRVDFKVWGDAHIVEDLYVGGDTIAKGNVSIIGNLTSDNAYFSGSVGIGTIAPAAELQVIGDIYDTTGFVQPVGAITMYGASAAPTGWLNCNGSAVSRTVTYAALFAVIGTTYGVGDGSTTFNVPDLASKFARGITPNTGGGSDDAVVVEHTHIQNPHRHGIEYNTNNAAGGGGQHIDSTGIGYSTAFMQYATATNQNTGESGIDKNIPAYVGVNFIIKY